jgi:hypothetical protein
MLGAAFIGLFFFFPETMWHLVHSKELIAQHNMTSSPEEKAMAVDLDGTGTGKATMNVVQERIFNELPETATAKDDPRRSNSIYPCRVRIRLRLLPGTSGSPGDCLPS